jgi:uncharacterized protein
MSHDSQKTLTVPCPRCRKPSLFGPENKFRPFCSERCRLIDLGQWANESYKIPTQIDFENEFETDTSDSGSSSDDDPLG